MGIFDFFTKKDSRSEASQENASIRKIIAELEHYPPQDAKYIAAFAYLLGRVAHSDLEISEEETREMEKIVRELAHLPEDQAILIIQIAKSQNTLFGATENYLVSREFKKMSTPQQRLDLLDCLFAVAGADDHIALNEEDEIRKIATEFGISHQELIQVRFQHRDKLAILKNLPK